MRATDWLPPTLHTAGLTLRPVTLADVDDVFAALSDPRATEHQTGRPHHTRADSVQYCWDARAWYQHKVPGTLAVAPRPRPDRLVGTCSLYPGECSATWELGFWVAPGYWGYGLATEAVGRLTAHAFDQYADAVRVQARVLVGNPASDRVLVKCGFVCEGTHRRAWVQPDGRVRDVRVYSRLRDDPAPG